MVFRALGTPTPETWPGAADLPNFLEFAAAPPLPLKKVFPGVRNRPETSPPAFTLRTVLSVQHVVIVGELCDCLELTTICALSLSKIPIRDE